MAQPDCRTAARNVSGRAQARGGRRAGRSYVPDHVRNPHKYTCYILDEPITVGGGDAGDVLGAGQPGLEQVGLAAGWKLCTPQRTSAVSESHTCISCATYKLYVLLGCCFTEPQDCCILHVLLPFSGAACAAFWHCKVQCVWLRTCLLCFLGADCQSSRQHCTSSLRCIWHCNFAVCFDRGPASCVSYVQIARAAASTAQAAATSFADAEPGKEVAMEDAFDRSRELPQFGGGIEFRRTEARPQPMQDDEGGGRRASELGIIRPSYEVEDEGENRTDQVWTGSCLLVLSVFSTHFSGV